MKRKELIDFQVFKEKLDMNCKVIATEDIRHGDVFFPKGSVLEIVSLKDIWRLESNLQFHRGLSEITDKKDIIDYKVPKNYSIDLPKDQYKLSEVPWISKIRHVGFGEYELIKEDRELASKYFKIYERRKEECKQENLPLYKEYCEKLRIKINQLRLPQNIRVYFNQEDQSTYISTYCFGDELTTFYFSTNILDLEKSYNDIVEFLDNL